MKRSSALGRGVKGVDGSAVADPQAVSAVSSAPIHRYGALMAWLECGVSLRVLSASLRIAVSSVRAFT